MDNNIKPIGDMYLAAALLAYNVPLQRVDRSDNKRQKFMFTDRPVEFWVVEDGVVSIRKNETLENMETSFIAKTLLFPPSYPDSLRRIKSAIHAED